MLMRQLRGLRALNAPCVLPVAPISQFGMEGNKEPFRAMPTELVCKALVEVCEVGDATLS